MRSLLAALLLLPLAAQAEKLRVDVLIFLNPQRASEHGTAPRQPDNDRAIAIDDVRGLAYAGVALLPETASTLSTEWGLLAKRGYQPQLRLSWLQDVPRREAGPALRIYLPGSDRIGGISGWLRLEPVPGASQGKAFYLAADLEAVQVDHRRMVEAFRLQERRRLQADTLHYLDSSRIGLLARTAIVP